MAASHDSASHDSASYRAALGYLHDRIDFEKWGSGKRHPFRLQRTRELFARLGLAEFLQEPSHGEGAGEFSRLGLANRADAPPYSPVPVVHIAGTKGKGSTANMVSEILVAAGYRVGLYTSPHLTDLEERFRVNGVPCDRDDLAQLVHSIRPVVDEMDADAELGQVSFFELTTALAVLHFARQRCDVIVLEVGLGGRLDSTNVCKSRIAIVTSIGLDHQRVLGNSLIEIAGEKAGIIKSSAPVVCGVVEPDVAAVIASHARLHEAPFFRRTESFETHEIRAIDDLRTQFRYAAIDPRLRRAPFAAQLSIELNVPGNHQVENASLAISALRLLASELPVSDADVQAGLSNVRCAGRIEPFHNRDGTRIIVDTAHNPDSIEALRDTMRTITRDGVKVVVVFAISHDKDARSIANTLGEFATQIVCTQFRNPPRFVPSDELAEICAGASATPAQSVTDSEDALQLAMKAAGPNGLVVICGSFFLAGELRPVVARLAEQAHHGSGDTFFERESDASTS